MVGDQGAAGGPAAGLTSDPTGLPGGEVRAAYDAAAGRWAAGPEQMYAALARAAYDAAAGRWAAGPEQMYAALARALLAAAGVPLAGCRMLDIGAGTGVAARAALAAGARQVVATDLAAGTLRRASPRAGRAGTALGRAVADATALPFRAGSFQLAVAAFCLSYLGSITAGLREAHRVAAALAASTFTPGWTHPAKPAIDAVLHQFGYCPPAWYPAFKQQTEPAAADPGMLARCASAAGFSTVRLRTTTVPTGLSTPRSWPRGGWAWRTPPRSWPRWTRRSRLSCGGPPSTPWLARLRWPCR
jgi:SAM-dependent methyltransferase